MSRQIFIDQKTLDDVFAQAVEEYPAEACGWIIQDKEGALNYVPVENLQDKYHKLDPDTYPRTSADAFLMDSLKLTRAIDEAQSGGGSLFSIVHSHIDCGAYFSEEDKHQMTLPEGGPIFPSDNYLVVSVEKGKPGETAIFKYDEKSCDFVAHDLVVKE